MKYLLLSTIFIVFLIPKNVFAAGFETEPKDFLIKTNIASHVTETLLTKNTLPQSQIFKFSWLGYTLPSDQIVNQTSLAKHSIDFATLNQESISIEPFGTGVVSLELKTPDKIQPGDYYGSLKISGEKEMKQVDFTVRILGKQDEKVLVSMIKDDEKNINLTLRNEGNQTTVLTASVDIKKLFGKTLQATSDEVSLKAGQKKTLLISKPSLSPGFYQEYPSLKYSGQIFVFSVSTSFWAQPWLFIISGLIVSLGLVLILFKLKKK